MKEALNEFDQLQAHDAKEAALTPIQRNILEICRKRLSSEGCHRNIQLGELLDRAVRIKSLFMYSFTKLERSYYAMGSSSTKSGIFDYLFEYRPRYIVADELEK